MTKSSELTQYLIDEIEQEYPNWLDLIASLTPGQLAKRPEDGWSVVDVLVHVTAWQENGLKIADTQKDPQAQTPDAQFGPSRVLNIDFEDFNQRVFEAHRDWGMEQALAWFESINSSLRSALKELPIERLYTDANKRAPFNWFWRPAIVHSREHRLDVENRFKETIKS